MAFLSLVQKRGKSTRGLLEAKATSLAKVQLFYRWCISEVLNYIQATRPNVVVPWPTEQVMPCSTHFMAKL